MNVTLRQLRVFLAVAEGRNFSRAGEQVGLTQPAVSRAIRELESQLGLKLLDRTTREVALTAAGQTLAARLARVLDEVDQTLLDVQGMARARRGRVRVASSPTLSANLMPACIAQCARDEPEIELQLLDRIQQDVLDSVRAGEVDFGVVIEPSSMADLDGEVILRDPFIAVMAPAHPLARHKSLRWSALDGQPLVLLDHASGSRRLIDQALADHGARGPVRQELGHPTTVLRMAKAGLGLSVLPGLVAHQARMEGLVTLPLRPLVEREIMLIHRRNRAPSPLAVRVWALVKSVARQLDAA